MDYVLRPLEVSRLTSHAVVDVAIAVERDHDIQVHTVPLRHLTDVAYSFDYFLAFISIGNQRDVLQRREFFTQHRRQRSQILA